MGRRMENLPCFPCILYSPETPRTDQHLHVRHIIFPHPRPILLANSVSSVLRRERAGPKYTAFGMLALSLGIRMLRLMVVLDGRVCGLTSVRRNLPSPSYFRGLGK